MRPYLSIGGHAPRWATHGQRPRRARCARAPRSSACSPRPPASTTRASHIWSIWNEPNLYSWLGPQRSKGTPLSPSIYRGLYLAGYRGLDAGGHGGDTILLGELMPRGGTSPRKVRPLEFLREMACLDRNYHQIRGRAAKKRGCRKVGRFPTSGIAYHPYTPARRAARARGPRRRRHRPALPPARHDRRARAARQAAAPPADLDHRVRLPDQAARPDLRRAACPRRRVHGRERVDRASATRAWPATRSTRCSTIRRGPARARCAGPPGRPGCASATAGPRSLRLRRVPPAGVRAHAEREPRRDLRRAPHAVERHRPDRVQGAGRQLPFARFCSSSTRPGTSGASSRSTAPRGESTRSRSTASRA